MEQDKNPSQEQPVLSKFPLNMPTSMPFLYANGILVGTTLGDVTMTITINGQATHQLNLSYTTAKTLMVNLQQAIADFEKGTETTVLEMREVSERMRKYNEKTIVPKK